MNRFTRAWSELCGKPADGDALARVCEKAVLDKQLADDIIESQEKRYVDYRREAAAELAQARAWTDQQGKIALEAVAQRDAALAALKDAGLRVDKLVDHLIDLKREGFSAASQMTPVMPPEATVFPASIERALNMRNFDDRVDRANRQYALEQLRERPDDADQIALEVIRGELQDSPEGTESTEETIAST